MTNNPKYRQQCILDLLKSDNTLSYTDCFTKYSLIFTKSKRTFAKDWKIANTSVKDYRIKTNNAKEKASIKIEVEAVKKGLKSKFERLMFYQDQIEVMEDQLTGQLEFYFLVGNKPLTSHPNGKFKLPIEKQNDIRKQIKEYQTEISRIEGDYEKDNKQKTAPTMQVVDMSTYKNKT